MRRSRSNKLKNFTLASLFIMAIFMAAAYAVYSTTMSISGTGKIISDWDLRFTSAILDEVTDGGEELATPVISEDGLTIDVAVLLTYYRDRIVYDVDISNFSTMFDAEYMGIEIDYKDSDPFIVWTINGISEGDLIARDSTATVDLIAYWDYEKADAIPSDITDDIETTHTERATITLKFQASSATDPNPPVIIQPAEPIAKIEYSTTDWINGNVVATLTFDDDTIGMLNNNQSQDSNGAKMATLRKLSTNEAGKLTQLAFETADLTILNNNGSNQYEFKENGKFAFEYGNSKGLRKTETATVTWIDKATPVITSHGNPKDNTWTNQDVTITPPLAGTASGFNKFLWNIDGGEWQEGWPGTFTDEINAVIGIIAINNVGTWSEPVYTTLKINKTAPTITLNGSETMTLEVHSPYIEPGAQAADQHGVNLTADINISGGVNPSVVGSYQITYNVVDAAGNSASAVRTINVVDTTPSGLTVNPATMTLNQYASFDLMTGVSAIDNYDENITNKVIVTPANSNWNVVTAATITRVFTYQVTDNNGNTASATRTITMIDKEAPVINVNANNVYVMEVNTPTNAHTKPSFNVTATDNVDASVNVVITDDINPDVVGSYTVTFTATDAAGNTSQTTKAFTVRDTIAPVTTLTGAGAMTLEVHSSYAEPGYTAFDHYDKDVTANVVVTTNLNTSVVGSYWVRYNVKDAAGNTATQRSRTINIVDTTKPVISITYPDGKDYVVVEKGANYNLLDGVSALDNYDGSITGKIVRSHNSIDTTHLGMYTVTYNVTDANGNKAVEATKRIKVSTKPVITITGAAAMEVNTPTDPHSLPNFSATAVDSLGAPVSVSITGTEAINTNIVGTYPVTYTAIDVDGKTQTIVQNFQVRDTQAPIFSFLGATYIEVGLGEGYQETGWLVSDHYSQPNQINASIRVTNSSGTTLATINTTGDVIPTQSLIPSSHLNTAGVYFLYYTVTEPAGNSQTYKREVVIYDSDLPSITLMLTNVYSMEVDTATDPHAIPQLAATANDKAGNPIPQANVVVTHNIIPNIPGNYTVTFTATDTVNGKVRVQTMPFTVTHNRGPIITLNGSATMTIYASSIYNGPSTYVEQGATAFDDYNGNVDVSISSNINPNVPGTYTVIYTAKDSANNTSTKNRTVIVTDNDKPIITFESDPLIVNQNATVDVMSGVSALDNVDGTITSKVMATPIIISSAWPGYFTVNYTVRDNAGNTTSTSRQIRIVDVTPPVITIDNTNVYSMEVDTTTTPNSIPQLQATATDNVDGNLTVSVTHDINPKIVGPYTVTFKAQDAHDNVTTQTRAFNVVDTTAPVLTIDQETVYVDQFTTFDLMSGVSALDNYDGDITSTVTVTPASSDWHVVTAATITRVFNYKIIDANGNSSTAQRTVIMNDKEKPIITINSSNVYVMEVNTASDPQLKPDFNASATDNVDASVNVAITDNININKVGNYTITFTATDNASNTASATKTFIVEDTTAPTISLATEEETIELHALFDAKAGVSAIDYYDGDLTDNIIVTGGVNPSVVGTYYLFYDVTDAGGNVATQMMKTVHVVNNTPPILTINPETVFVNQFASYNLMTGVNAIDNYNTDITNKVLVSPEVINYNVVGTHTITYTVTDIDGNVTTKARTIIINDKEAPIIFLNPSNTYVMEVNTSTTPNSKPEFNANATDNVDPEVEVIINDDININVVGTYSVTFSATDSAGNYTSVTKDFIVQDTTPPVLTMIGQDVGVYGVGGEYFDQGATATDNYDGDLTNKIIVTSNVNPNVVGSYSIDYEVKDAAGNTAKITRRAHFVDLTPPEIIIDEDNIYVMEVSTEIAPNPKPEFKATVIDNVDANIGISITDNINVEVVGTYTITFKAVDANRNEQVVTRDFIVQDTTPPTITLNGPSEITLEVHSSYTELGAEATDSYDGVITNKIIATGSLNPSEVGTYYIDYNVSDNAGNAAVTQTRTINVVDTTAPVLTIDPLVVSVNQFTSYDLMTGVSANDNNDGDITDDVIITSSAIDFNVVAEYTVTYRITDSNGNATTAQRTIMIIDQEAPKIIIDPSNIYVMEVSTDAVSIFKPDFQAEATDNVDPNVTVTISDDIKENIVGEYLVTFTAIDAAGNIATASKTFIVRDTTLPLITLAGSEVISLEVHGNYTDLGASAWDNYDKDITGNIEVTGSINPSVMGTYYIYYNVKDAAGNQALTVKRTINVVDTTAPVITLNGPAAMTIEVHGSYTESGATALDNYDGELTADIVMTGFVNVNALGTYYIYYNVKDTTGNSAATMTRTVQVVDTTPPVITVNAGNVYAMEVSTDTSPNSKPIFYASATDNFDLGVSVTPNDNIDIKTPGTYTITFTATDNAGNTATVTKDFIVEDTTAPVITLNGLSSIVLELGSTYTELGATAFDNYDGALTDNIVITGSINPSVIGTYYIYYNVKDAAQNSAIQLIRTIYVEDVSP